MLEGGCRRTNQSSPAFQLLRSSVVNPFAFETDQQVSFVWIWYTLQSAAGTGKDK